ncbi:MAG: c-type cytochrome, partial [Bacteroidota bacterium]
VELTVIDPAGESATAYQKIIVGNTAPKLEVELADNGGIFYTGKTIDYQIKVSDQEDGSTTAKTINPDDVKVTLNYLPEGQDMVVAAIGHQQSTEPIGLQLINGSDCKACHAANEKVAGPSYVDIAKKYGKKDKNQIISRIIKGSSGIWGEKMMSAHPQLAVEDVDKMVSYILSLDPDKENFEKDLPLSGTITFEDHQQTKSDGIYVLMASYLDKGNPDVEGAQLAAQQQIIFKAPVLEAEHSDQRTESTSVFGRRGRRIVGGLKHNAFLQFNNVDLAALKNVRLEADFNKKYRYEGMVEIREGKNDGPMIGQTAINFIDKEKNARVTFDIPVQSATSSSDLFVVFKNETDEKRFVMNLDKLVLKYD